VSVPSWRAAFWPERNQPITIGGRSRYLINFHPEVMGISVSDAARIGSSILRAAAGPHRRPSRTVPLEQGVLREVAACTIAEPLNTPTRHLAQTTGEFHCGTGALPAEE
jgi:hypothetical protein